MIPELGNFALIIALCIAVIQAVVPLAGTFTRQANWVAVARPAARGQFGFVLISFACLVYAFIVNDFSVTYVAQNSNSNLPLQYRISAVWGAHEGSLLLWVLILSLWSLAVSIFSKHLPDELIARVIAVMGMVSIGFLLFILLTSNPFERLFPAALDGRDLNPLLQDFGLIVHPPMLYMGYVGFSVAFAFAIAALMGGQLDSAWARWSRPWTIVAWVFLTLGIALGSWWAYYELGWGGWWFWDPVENASFMPWLVGTALIHSLAVTEKRGTFKSWTVMLAILAFSLSLLGTFLVRSGVLTSVHAFATDPARGVFILGFLCVVIGCSLVLYAWRAPSVMSTGTFTTVSKETFLLMNNVILVVVAATVLLGTLYPLVMDALGLGKISVGPPYFQGTFVPLMLPLLFLSAIGPYARWKKHSVKELVNLLRVPFLLATAVALITVFLDNVSWVVAIINGLIVWMTYAVVALLARRIKKKENWIKTLRSVPPSFYGMVIAHLGLAVFLVGATYTSSYSEEKDIRMSPGDRLALGGYEFRFDGVKHTRGPNYEADQGSITVFKDNEEYLVLKPQKRLYLVQQSPMTEAGIDAGLFRDLFVALGEPVGNKDWSVRIQHKPFVRWIWLGCIFMAVGGFIAASDRRYRVSKKVTEKSANLTKATTKPAVETGS